MYQILTTMTIQEPKNLCLLNQCLTYDLQGPYKTDATLTTYSQQWSYLSRLKFSLFVAGVLVLVFCIDTIYAMVVINHVCFLFICHQTFWTAFGCHFGQNLLRVPLIYHKVASWWQFEMLILPFIIYNIVWNTGKQHHIKGKQSRNMNQTTCIYVIKSKYKWTMKLINLGGSMQNSSTNQVKNNVQI